MMIQYVLTKAEWDDYHEANHILAKIKAILSTSGIYNHELSIPAMTMYLVAKNDELNAAHKTIKEVTEQRDGLRAGIDCASDQLSKVTEQRDEMTLRWELTNDSLFDKRALADRLAEELTTTQQAHDVVVLAFRKVDAELTAAREELADLKKHIDVQNKLINTLQSKKVKFKEQRDRLAEALEEIKRTEPANHNGDLFYPRYTEDGDWAGDEPVDPYGLLAFIYPRISEALQSLNQNACLSHGEGEKRP